MATEIAPAAVGKKELAAALGWSRPRLDRRLNEDPKFPVVNRGDQAGGWQFDPRAVKRHLDGDKKALHAAPAKTSSPAIDRAQLRDTVKLPDRAAHPRQSVPRRSAHHEGEASARQRKDLADAQLKENKVRLENGELVEVSEVRQTMSEIFAGIGNDLEALPEEITKRLDLDNPEAAAAEVQTLIDEMRAAMVRRLEILLQDS